MADLPKTYKLTHRYKEGINWSTIYKGKRVYFTLGKEIKRIPRPGMCDEIVCEVLPA